MYYILFCYFLLGWTLIRSLWFNFTWYQISNYRSSVQLFAGNDADEFNAVLKQQTTPKVLITTCRFNSGVCIFYAYHLCFWIFVLLNILCWLFWIDNYLITSILKKLHLTLYVYLHICLQRGPAFIEELMQVIPNSCYVKRGTYELKKVWHVQSS